MTKFVLQSFKNDTLAADITDAATSATLTTGNFGTPTGEQMFVIDYDVAAKREIVKAACDGTALTSIDRAQDGTSAVAHSSGAKVIMAFTPSHYTKLTDFVGARAYLGSTLGTTVSGGSGAKVALDTETYDIGSNFADGRFTAPVAGYYQVNASVYYQAADTGKYYTCMVKKNTTAVITTTVGYVTSTAGGPCVTANDIVHLDAGEYLELWYLHNGATTVDVYGSAASTFMTVHLVKED